MAGIKLVVNSGEVSTGTALKTILQITAPANHRLKVSGVSLTGKGTNNTASPLLVQVMRQTTAGTATSATALIVPKDSTIDESIQTTAQKNATVEPTAGAILMTREVHPQGGFDWQAPFGEELIVPGGTRLAIVVTAAVDVSVNAELAFEE